MENEYKKKSYKLLCLLFGGFVVSLVLWVMVASRLSLGTAATRGIGLLLVIFMPTLMYVIYKTERIYWINSVTYEEARAATSEQRKKFALSHLKIFATVGIICVAVSIICSFASINGIVDFIFCILMVPVAAIRTIPIKL